MKKQISSIVSKEIKKLLEDDDKDEADAATLQSMVNAAIAQRLETAPTSQTNETPASTPTTTTKKVTLKSILKNARNGKS